jgi:hypothetical protein
MADLVVYPTAAGTFLEFRTDTGQVARVQVEDLAVARQGEACRAILKWCEEIQTEAAMGESRN